MSLIERGDVAGVRRMLDRGADPSYRHRFSWAFSDALGTSETPILWIAAKAGKADVVRLLVELGARIEDVSSSDPVGRGTTPLGIAAFCGRKDVVVELVKLGARAEPKVEWSSRPLFLALFGPVHAPEGVKPSVFMEIADILTQHGANPIMLDADGCTLLHAQTTQYSRASLQWVLNHGVSLNARDQPRNYPPLYMAIVNHQIDAVAFFLERGADTNIRDWKGRTALTLAQDCGFTDIEELLQKKKR